MLRSWNCTAKSSGCFSVAVGHNNAAVAHSAISAVVQILYLSPAARGVPLSSDLLGIHARGRRAIWRRQGSLDGTAPFGALPSVSRRRLRSRPVVASFLTESLKHGRTGKWR